MTEQVQLDERDRFAFGANWSRFLSVLNDERIAEAETSLKGMLGVETLRGHSFLDIGCGSGLFSLAARRLGARVHSFDYDLDSVACTAELKLRYFPEDPEWTIEQGSVLDHEYMQSLGRFSVVYSWGVLHHTGAMWIGIEHALQRVADAGKLYIAIYNDQGPWSRAWWMIKHLYVKMPRPLKSTYAQTVWYSITGLNILKHTLKLRPMTAIRPLLSYKPRRGMSVKHDILDWIGGYPFEYVKYDHLVAFLEVRGFMCTHGVPNHGIGCHEVVAVRNNADSR